MGRSHHSDTQLSDVTLIGTIGAASGICQVKSDFINKLLRERGYTKTKAYQGQSVVTICTTPFPETRVAAVE